MKPSVDSQILSNTSMLLSTQNCSHCALVYNTCHVQTRAVCVTCLSPFLAVEATGTGRFPATPTAAPRGALVLGPLVPATRETVFPRDTGTVTFLLPELVLLRDDTVDKSDADDTSDDIDRLRQIFLSAAFCQHVIQWWDGHSLLSRSIKHFHRLLIQ